MDNAKHYDDAAIALIESRRKSNTHRINELTEHQVALDRLVTSVEVVIEGEETVYLVNRVEVKREQTK